MFLAVMQQPTLAFTIAVRVSARHSLSVLGQDLRKVAALQQTDLGGGVPGGAGPDCAGFQHQYILTGASQQNRGYQASDPSAHHDHISAMGAIVKLAGSPRLLDSVT
jgi:hypothetical protein